MDVICHLGLRTCIFRCVGVCVCVFRCLLEHTFLNDSPLVIEHALDLAASHIGQTCLLHKRLATVEACAVQEDGSHCDQKANIVLPQT